MYFEKNKFECNVGQLEQTIYKIHNHQFIYYLFYKYNMLNNNQKPQQHQTIKPKANQKLLNRLYQLPKLDKYLKSSNVTNQVIFNSSKQLTQKSQYQYLPNIYKKSDNLLRRRLEKDNTYVSEKQYPSNFSNNPGHNPNNFIYNNNLLKQKKKQTSSERKMIEEQIKKKSDSDAHIIMNDIKQHQKYNKDFSLIEPYSKNNQKNLPRKIKRFKTDRSQIKLNQSNSYKNFSPNKNNRNREFSLNLAQLKNSTDVVNKIKINHNLKINKYREFNNDLKFLKQKLITQEKQFATMDSKLQNSPYNRNHSDTKAEKKIFKTEPLDDLQKHRKQDDDLFIGIQSILGTPYRNKMESKEFNKSRIKKIKECIQELEKKYIALQTEDNISDFNSDAKNTAIFDQNIQQIKIRKTNLNYLYRDRISLTKKNGLEYIPSSFVQELDKVNYCVIKNSKSIEKYIECQQTLLQMQYQNKLIKAQKKYRSPQK